MWIDRSEYDALKKAAEEVKEDKRIKPLQERIETLEKLIDDERESHEKTITNLEADNKILLDRKDAEVETKVSKATKSLTDELTKITMEKNNATQKAEILETAFKNLGFDVKDMKSILNKLVDGLVSKNTIQLVK